mgnify:CR=1 FL=1
MDVPYRPDPLLVEGLRRIRARGWHQAHEPLEEAWRATAGDERRCFLRGLIHATDALGHLSQGSPLSAFQQWSKNGASWKGLPPSVEGVAIGSWRATLERFLRDEACLAERVKAQLEGGVAADPGVDRAVLPPLPLEETWPQPPLDSWLEERMRG